MSIIEVSTNKTANGSATAVSSADETVVMPNCEWESKFLAIVDSVCTTYEAPLESFLSRSWD